MLVISEQFFSSFLIYATFLAFAMKRLMTYLHAYQQEEYDNQRFFNWIKEFKIIDKRLSGVIFVTGILWFFVPWFVSDLLAFLGFAVTAYKERDPRYDGKKKLNFTSRATRIYFIALAICALPALFVFITHQTLLWLPIIHMIPAALVLGNTILNPFENIVQSRYWGEANSKIRSSDVTVIGVTGSFGKTSIKHILGHILKSAAPTLITPGSVNTPMGIARIIREELDETHQYAIIEMGAYGHGSIARLCDLTPPDYGIISAIGHAHYERFKTLDAVAETKFELAEAVMEKGGKTIVHENTLKYEHSRDMYDDSPEFFVTVGEGEANEVSIPRIEQTIKGLDVRVRWENKTYYLEVPLFGVHHGHNVALAFALACTLGFKPQDVATILKSVPQIPHRLEVKPNRQFGSLIIDDAYNSNPQGFRAALDLLHQLGNQRRKILITPGMVELGAAHDDMHRTMGKYAARCVDICIVVNSKRIPTFVEGFDSERTQNQELMEMDSFSEAQKWVSKEMGKNDVILIENDLPDIYERLPVM